MLDDSNVVEYADEDTSDTSVAVGRSIWRSIFCCCRKRKRIRLRISKGYNLEESDEIVEKLVVKRVPLALFAASNEQRRGDNAMVKEKSAVEYPVMPEVRSTLYFSNNNQASPNVSGIPSNKSLRFQNDQDILDEDVVEPGPSNYAKNMPSPFDNNRFTQEYMNRWSALHPDLKENERAPKDPETLNATHAKRRLAEIISEAAATQRSLSPKLPRAKNSKNAYSTGFNNPKAADKEIPTLHKRANKTTSFKDHKTSAATSSTKPSRHQKAEIELQNIHDERRKERDFQREYRSRKVVAHNTSEFESFVENQRSNYSKTVETNDDESDTNVISRATDEVRNAIVNGTTLRWKVIIDHRQLPPPSETESTSDPPAGSSLPMLRDIFGNLQANRNCNPIAQAKVPDKTIYTADKDVSYKRS